MKAVILTISLFLAPIAITANMVLKGGTEHIEDPALCSTTTNQGCAKDQATSAALDEFPYWNRRGYWVTSPELGAIQISPGAVGCSSIYLGSKDGIVGWVGNADHCSLFSASADEYLLLDNGAGASQTFTAIDEQQLDIPCQNSNGLGCAATNTEPRSTLTTNDHYVAVVARRGETLPDLALIEFAPTRAFFGPTPFTLWLSMGTGVFTNSADIGWYPDCVTPATDGVTGCLADREPASYDPASTPPSIGHQGVGNPTRPNGEVCGPPRSPSTDVFVTTDWPSRACTGGEGCRDPDYDVPWGGGKGTIQGITPCNSASGYADASHSYLGPTWKPSDNEGPPVPSPSASGRKWQWALQDNYLQAGTGYMVYKPANYTYETQVIEVYPDIDHPANTVYHRGVRGVDDPVHLSWLQFPDTDIGFNHYRWWFVAAVYGNEEDPGAVAFPNGEWQALHDIKVPDLCNTSRSPTGKVLTDETHGPCTFLLTYGVDYPIQDYPEVVTSGDSGSPDFVYWKQCAACSGKWYLVGMAQTTNQGGHPFDELKYGKMWQFLNGTYDDSLFGTDDSGAYSLYQSWNSNAHGGVKPATYIGRISFGGFTQ